MNPVLVLLCHPALEKSRINAAMSRAAKSVRGVVVHDLYEEYPDFDVDVPREQALLLESRAIVLQHPFYWYSTPALLKQWFDLVLEHGFAYGKGGQALEGKRLLSAISTGGGAEAYEPTGFHAATIGELLAPIRQTARLCGMIYESPFVAHGAFRMTGPELDEVSVKYRVRLEQLRDAALGRPDTEAPGKAGS